MSGNEVRCELWQTISTPYQHGIESRERNEEKNALIDDVRIVPRTTQHLSELNTGLLHTLFYTPDTHAIKRRLLRAPEPLPLHADAPLRRLFFAPFLYLDFELCQRRVVARAHVDFELDALGDGVDRLGRRVDDSDGGEGARDGECGGVDEDDELCSGKERVGTTV